MDFASLFNVVKLLPHTTSILIRGRHGIGKSQAVYQFGDFFKLPVMERRISQMTEGDLIGMPFRFNDKLTKFLPLDWFQACIEEPHTVFIDEMDRGSTEVQQACFELVLDRSIQGKKIHPDCRIFSAVNGGLHGANYTVNEMDAAMVDRFFVVDLEPTVDDWVAWAKRNNIHPIIIDFIDTERKQSQTPLEHKGMFEPGQIYSSRRSWARTSECFTMNSELLEKPNENRIIIRNICNGFVGPAATSAFLQYLRAEKIFTATMIMDDFKTHRSYFEKDDVRTDAAFLNNICDKIYQFIEDSDGITNRQLDNMYQFWLTMAGELKMKMYEELTTNENFSTNIKSSFVEKCASDMVDLVSG